MMERATPEVEGLKDKAGSDVNLARIRRKRRVWSLPQPRLIEAKAGRWRMGSCVSPSLRLVLLVDHSRVFLVVSSFTLTLPYYLATTAHSTPLLLIRTSREAVQNRGTHITQRTATSTLLPARPPSLLADAD